MFQCKLSIVTSIRRKAYKQLWLYQNMKGGKFLKIQCSQLGYLFVFSYHITYLAPYGETSMRSRSVVSKHLPSQWVCLKTRHPAACGKLCWSGNSCLILTSTNRRYKTK